MTVALAVHGGAWNIPDDMVEPSRHGLFGPLKEGHRALARGSSAIDVVERVVRALEDDPAFNAGRGSHLNSEGALELDASIMEGTGLRAGAVAAVSGLRHPVSVARRVLEDSPHVLLVGAGAKRFARRVGAEIVATPALLVGRELERYRRIRAGERDLVALDRRGRVAAATSTGGTQDKAPGRVGDTPVVGAGTYADDRGGAASCTGWGEAILRIVMAKTAVDALASGRTPERASSAAVAALARVQGFGGIVVVDGRGRAGCSFNTPRMARGFADARGLHVLVGRDERRR